MTAPLVRYPAGGITPAGRCELRQGRKPMMAYVSPDGTVVFNLMGPLAIWDRTMPERVQVKTLKGLIPPWENIEQKGATQDGSTYVTSLYDPMDVEIGVVVYGRDPAWTRKVLRNWIDSWDAKLPGRLSWTTIGPNGLGYWWANVRWSKPALESLMGGLFNRQPLTMYAKAYDGFWRSYDSVDSFGIQYAAVTENFSVANPTTLNSEWTVNNYGGPGNVYDTGYSASFSLEAGQTVVARLNTYTSGTDNQVITVTFGNMPAAWLHYGYNDIWFRMANTGTPGTDGMRLRIGDYKLRLSSFSGGAETVLREQQVFLSPLEAGDQITVIANGGNYVIQYGGTVGLLGFPHGLGGPLLRNPLFTRKALLTLMSVFDTTTPVNIGSAYRSVGFGAQCETSGQLPGDVIAFSAADYEGPGNIPQTGFLTRVNAGDQPMWDRFTLIGPGTFGMGQVGNNDMVYMGPLLDGQIVQLRTDPRKRGVVDISSAAPIIAAAAAASSNSGFHPFGGLFAPITGAISQAVADIEQFASNPLNLGAAVSSIFGVQAPQGNLYSLLQGRWANPVPPKPPASPPQQYQIPVSIEGGGPTSAIFVAGTPLRRFPQ